MGFIHKGQLPIWLIIMILFFNCNPKKLDKEVETNLIKGTFAYDMDFLQSYYEDLVILGKGNAQVIVSPSLQGRVMTSTASGESGQSFGWLNYGLIASGERMEHFNPTGGEERLWLGPEGGQFSIYFKPETNFDFKNWYVPKELDTEPFDLVSQNNSEASFEKNMKLVNYSGTEFDLKVDRKIRLISETEASAALGIVFPERISMVGFESENRLTNTGNRLWDKESGMISIWILSMLNCNEGTTIIIPFKVGGEARMGPIVTDDYFGKVPKERLVIKDSVILLKGDGKHRDKIGISPIRALSFMGSYDTANKVLTVAHFTLPEGENDYVNSKWEHQAHPFVGDAVNAYNDGPMEDGTQLGPFYELESSSPAASLAPDESMVHRHQTYHFEGDTKALDEIAQQLLGISLDSLKF